MQVYKLILTGFKLQQSRELKRYLQDTFYISAEALNVVLDRLPVTLREAQASDEIEYIRSLAEEIKAVGGSVEIITEGAEQPTITAAKQAENNISFEAIANEVEPDEPVEANKNEKLDFSQLDTGLAFVDEDPDGQEDEPAEVEAATISSKSFPDDLAFNFEEEAVENLEPNLELNIAHNHELEVKPAVEADDKSDEDLFAIRLEEKSSALEAEQTATPTPQTPPDPPSPNLNAFQTTTPATPAPIEPIVSFEEFNEQQIKLAPALSHKAKLLIGGSVILSLLLALYLISNHKEQAPKIEIDVVNLALSQLEAQRAKEQKIIAAKKEQAEALVKAVYSWQETIESDATTVELSASASKSQLLNLSLVIGTPEAPALTPKEIVDKVPPHAWLARFESNFDSSNIQMTSSTPDGRRLFFSASTTGRAYLRAGKDARRLVGRIAVNGSIDLKEGRLAGSWLIADNDERLTAEIEPFVKREGNIYHYLIKGDFSASGKKLAEVKEESDEE